MKKLLLPLLFLFILLLSAGFACFAEEAIYTSRYYLNFYPDYPPIVGKRTALRLKTFKPAQKVSLFSDREQEIPLYYKDNYWWGVFSVPADYKEGGHFFTVWIKYPFASPPPPKDPLSALLLNVGLKRQSNAFWDKSVLWYRMVKAPAITLEAGAKDTYPPFFLTEEAEEPIPVVTGEAVEITVPSLEALPFIIKGTKTLSFTSKSIEGSKEGFVPGVTREEGLRLNIAGRKDDLEVDANLISASTAGTALVSQREDKISVLVKKASTEAYLGDFTADLTETEFTRLNKVLSGVRVKGDYDRWGFSALYSSPKGEAKYKRTYGDGTQGPYRLDSAPVVIDSERVSVDGVLQKRGDDYTVDYQAGTVTFTKKTIDLKSILEVYYDYRQTVYQHATYGLRLATRPYSNLKVGATYLDDSDSLAGAANIRGSMTGEAVDPVSHSVVGIDGSLVSEILTANGEFAYSMRNLNLLSSGGSEESGNAIKLDVASQLGPFGITARGKKVGAKFMPVADPNPKQNITEYGAGLSFRPGSLFGAQGNQNYEKYTQSGVVYENKYQSAKTSLTPDRFPSLEYNFSENNESNDPVSGGNIQRVITRNSAETLYRLGFLSASLKGATEKWISRAPSEEATNYRKVNVGLATVGIDKITFTSNVELENRQEPSGAAPYRRTYNLNLSASPAKPYFVSTSIEYLNDSAQGIKNVTDLSYRVEPGEAFKTDGKYTITSIKEDFATSEAVSKYTGSFSFDLRPTRYLRLRYLFKPNFTRLLRNDAMTYKNEQQQGEINLIPMSEIMLGLIHKTGRAFNIYKMDYPNYTIKDNTADTNSTLYSLKMAPIPILSTEFNYLLEDGATTQRVTSEPLSYTPGRSFDKKFDAIARTSLTEKFSIDSRYTYQRSTQGTGEAIGNLIDGISHTASLKGIWNPNDFWSFSVSGAYTRATNNLSSTPVTYTFSPGTGFIYRRGDRFRLDFDLTYSKAQSGASTEKTNISLRGKYSISDYVNITLRGEREISSAPDYKLTDISGNVEINL